MRERKEFEADYNRQSGNLHFSVPAEIELLLDIRELLQSHIVVLPHPDRAISNDEVTFDDVEQPQRDEKYEEAVELLKNWIRAVPITSRVFREQFGISVARASQLMDELFKGGIIRKDEATGRHYVV